MKKLHKIILINIFTAILFIADRLSKYYVLENPEKLRDFSIENIIMITLAKNRNSVFGIKFPLFIVIALSVVAIVFLVSLLKRAYQNNNFTNIFLLSTVIIGAISNIIDRISLGYVIDFIEISRFSIFNIADILIVVCVVVLILLEIKKVKKV